MSPCLTEPPRPPWHLHSENIPGTSVSLDSSHPGQLHQWLSGSHSRGPSPSPLTLRLGALPVPLTPGSADPIVRKDMSYPRLSCPVAQNRADGVKSAVQWTVHAPVAGD